MAKTKIDSTLTEAFGLGREMAETSPYLATSPKDMAWQVGNFIECRRGYASYDRAIGNGLVELHMGRGDTVNVNGIVYRVDYKAGRATVKPR